jgi:hypothetical protein
MGAGDVELLPSICKVLGSIPSTGKKINEMQRTKINLKKINREL